MDSFDLDSGIVGIALFNGGLLKCPVGAWPNAVVAVVDVGESSKRGFRSLCWMAEGGTTNVVWVLGYG